MIQWGDSGNLLKGEDRKEAEDGMKYKESIRDKMPKEV